MQILSLNYLIVFIKIIFFYLILILFHSPTCDIDQQKRFIYSIFYSVMLSRSIIITSITLTLSIILIHILEFNQQSDAQAITFTNSFYSDIKEGCFAKAKFNITYPIDEVKVLEPKDKLVIFVGTTFEISVSHRTSTSATDFFSSIDQEAKRDLPALKTRFFDFVSRVNKTFLLGPKPQEFGNFQPNQLKQQAYLNEFIYKENNKWLYGAVVYVKDISDTILYKIFYLPHDTDDSARMHYVTFREMVSTFKPVEDCN